MTNWKNRLLRLLYWFLLPWCKKHSLSTNRRILVISTTGLGDTIWAIPALTTLRASFPSSYLSILTSRIGEEVLRKDPSVDSIYLWRSPFFLWRRLYRERFDHVLIFHASQRSVFFFSTLLGAQQVVGSAGQTKQLDWIFTQVVSQKFEHEVERRSRIIETIGSQAISSAPEMILSEEEVQEQLLPQGKWVALHPGAKEKFRRWPISHFVEVGRFLQKQGMRILITGSLEEEELMKSLAAELSGAVLLDSQSSVRQLAVLLQQMSLVISNDTGPLHLAAALKRPVIGLYGPTDPGLCGPYRAEQATIISCSPTCQPCLKKRCRSPFCLLQIGAKETIKAICPSG